MSYVRLEWGKDPITSSNSTVTGIYGKEGAMAPNNQIFILIVVAIISLLFGAAVTLLVLHRRRRRQSQRLWRSLASLREKHRRLCQEGDPRYNEALSLVEASTANL